MIESRDNSKNYWEPEVAFERAKWEYEKMKQECGVDENDVDVFFATMICMGIEKRRCERKEQRKRDREVAVVGRYILCDDEYGRGYIKK